MLRFVGSDRSKYAQRRPGLRPGNVRSEGVDSHRPVVAQRRPGLRPGNVRGVPRWPRSWRVSAQRRPGLRPGNVREPTYDQGIGSGRSTKAGSQTRQRRRHVHYPFPTPGALNEGRVSDPATSGRPSRACVRPSSLNEGRVSDPATSGHHAHYLASQPYAQRRPGLRPGNVGRPRRGRPSCRGALNEGRVSDPATSGILGHRPQLPGPLNEGRVSDPATSPGVGPVGPQQVARSTKAGSQTRQRPATRGTGARVCGAQRRPGLRPGNVLSVPPSRSRLDQRSTKAGSQTRQRQVTEPAVADGDTPLNEGRVSDPATSVPSEIDPLVLPSAQRRPGLRPGNVTNTPAATRHVGQRSTKAGSQTRQRRR